MRQLLARLNPTIDQSVPSIGPDENAELFVRIVAMMNIARDGLKQALLLGIDVETAATFLLKKMDAHLITMGNMVLKSTSLESRRDEIQRMVEEMAVSEELLALANSNARMQEMQPYSSSPSSCPLGEGVDNDSEGEEWSAEGADESLDPNRRLFTNYEEEDDRGAVSSLVPSAVSYQSTATPENSTSQSFYVDVETEYNLMSSYFEAHTVAAGNPAVLFAIRRIVENSFAHGNLSNVIDFMEPFVALLEAKSSFAAIYARSVQKNAESVPTIGREMTMGDIAHHLGRNSNSSEDEVNSDDELLNLILTAIDARNEDSEERIRVDSYGSMNRALKNQLVVFVDICIAINAMSILRLSSFCSSHLLAKVKELVGDSADMTMKDFTEKTIPILYSDDTPKVKAAIEVTCEMRKNMTDDILRPIFEPAQNMRFGGRGSGTGIDHCGGEGKQKVTRRATMVNLYLMLALAYVIEKEFRNGFFNRYGSFAGTILRSSWREIERASRPFLNREFFSTFGYNYDKSKQTSFLEGLMRNNVKDGMPLVIIDQEQWECLQTLCMADTI